jgi:hypothetical protein
LTGVSFVSRFFFRTATTHHAVVAFCSAPVIGTAMTVGLIGSRGIVTSLLLVYVVYTNCLIECFKERFVGAAQKKSWCSKKELVQRVGAGVGAR